MNGLKSVRSHYLFKSSLFRGQRPSLRGLADHIIQGEACPYGEACTFCYNKEEEEIWTWERRGLFNRNRKESQINNAIAVNCIFDS